MNRNEKAAKKKSKRAEKARRARVAEPPRPLGESPIAARIRLPLFRGERGAVAEILAEGHTAEKVDELADNALSFVEAVTADAQESAPKAIACREGCSWCCHIRVGLSEPEVLRIASYLRANRTPGELAEVLGRARDAAARARGLSADEHYTARIPCALLVEGKCSVYPVRPIACAGYNSASEAECRSAFDNRNPKGANLCYLPQLYGAGSVALGLAQGLLDAGLHASALELNAALVLALEDETIGDRWLAGEHPFAAAVGLESQRLQDEACAFVRGEV